MAIPRRSCLDTFQAVCEGIAFARRGRRALRCDHRHRGGAPRRGGLRINPGNIGGLAKTDAVLDAAGRAGIPIRIGVNAGSLDQALAERNDAFASREAGRLRAPVCGILRRPQLTTWWSAQRPTMS